MSSPTAVWRRTATPRSASLRLSHAVFVSARPPRSIPLPTATISAVVSGRSFTPPPAASLAAVGPTGASRSDQRRNAVA